MAPVPDTPSSSSSFKQHPWGTVFANKMLIIPWNSEHGWKQPSIRPSASIPLPPAASVFHYGTSVFEGIKVFNTSTGPCIFRPDLHIRRLHDSASRIALPTPPSSLLPTLQSYVRTVREWLPVTPPDALYLRVTLLATNQQLGGRTPTSALLFAIATPVGAFLPLPPTALQSGLRLYTDVRHTRAAPGGVGFCKTGGNYAASLAPQRDAKEQGFDQVLWLSDLTTRTVSEVGVMNIFFAIRDDSPSAHVVLETPEIDGSFLDGVTRRSVLALAHDMGFHTRQRAITIDEVFNAARDGRLVGAFGTGTAAVVCPVSSITCEGETVNIREMERDGDLSVAIRKRLLEIHGDGGHAWMTSIDDEAAKRTVVVESDDEVTMRCIGLS